MPPAKPKTFMRGAKLTPAAKLKAVPHYALKVGVPEEFAIVPARLDGWGNFDYGDCVTAEESFAKACHSPLIWITEAETVAWARSHGYLNGASLTEVMDDMRADGFVQGAQRYNDGPYAQVDWATEAVLRGALASGPVKIAIAGDSLPAGAGNEQGWHALGGRRNNNTDHCVALCGYGTAAYLYKALNVPLPPGLSPTLPGYLLFTWSTIGFVDHAWIMATTAEAFIRRPTTIGVPPIPEPIPPGPGPGPGPGPIPGPNTVAIHIPATTIQATFDGGVIAPADAARLEAAAATLGMTMAELMTLLMTLLQVLLPLLMRAKPAGPSMPAGDSHKSSAAEGGE